MSLAVKAGMAKRPATALQRLGRLRAPSGHFIPESHLNELARMLDCTSAVSGFRVRRIGINDSVWLVTCPANPEGWMIKKVPAHRRYSGVPTDVENCDAPWSSVVASSSGSSRASWTIKGLATLLEGPKADVKAAVGSCRDA
ncbi:unnamed protein product [Symbiodinium natans]|uniref:Uncharacterized protein n=1 Tax=Symbiodinium natans TaxID=878477 RepID=A0A812N3J4_9DINO|nr:unnamed protein product [Symbiodinium natans]